jgi:hypothetical protein
VNSNFAAMVAASVLFWLGPSATAQAEPAAPASVPEPSAPVSPTPTPVPPAAESPATAEPGAPALAAQNAELQKQINVQRADIDEQEAGLEELRQQVKELRKHSQSSTPPKPGVSSAPLSGPSPALGAERGLRLTGYFQAQYETHQDSEDQLAIGGAPLNQDRFVLRRARLKLERDWAYGGVMFEVDANTVHGPAFVAQHAEISLAYRDEQQHPFVQLTGGLFDNPFGWEVVESPRDRPFMERSFASRGFFPAEPDLGVRLSGQVAWFRYAVAVVNGQPLGDRTGFVLQDPNAHKDIVGRVGVAVDASPAVQVRGGVSVLNGKGFHAGSDPTKNTLVWKDSNENGQLDNGEERAAPGTAAVPSQNFDRWALGADLELELRARFGTTKLTGEVTAGSDMDRNVFIADPITTGYDERELGGYVSLIEEFSFGAIVGFRYDTYNPDSDFLDSSRLGKFIPASETVTTYAPLLGFQVPHHARLVAEYDFIHDAMARDVEGVPTDKKNNIFTVRLQGEL